MKKLSNIIETISKVNGFAILKPEFLDHEDDFLTLLKNSGWRVIQKKKGALTQEQAEALYKQHSDKPFFKDLCKYMTSGDCLACSCQKDSDNPIKDMTALKDKVRQKWGKDDMKNAMHSADSEEAVEREAGIVFNNAVAEGLEDQLTVAYQVPVESPIVKELKSLYCEEVNAFYQYWIVKDFLVGRERPSIAKKYEEWAMDELTDHGSKLLKRLSELDADMADMLNLYANNEKAEGKYIMPAPSFDTLTSIQQNIEAEQAAINHYSRVILMTEDIDPTTNKILKEILADEEEHKSELKDFLMDLTAQH